MKETQADAWIICAATREVLTWFAEQRIPTFALGGRAQDLPMASTRADLVAAMQSVVDSLVGHGHRRIVLICPRVWRHPTPNPTVAAFLSQMKSHRVSVGAYNIPEWNESAEGLQALLSALFFTTPPTALLISEPKVTAATLAFLAQRSHQVPRDVSIVSTLSDPVFALNRPIFAHFRSPIAEHVRHAVRWAHEVARGQTDHTQTSFPVQFDPGGTIALARR